MTKAELMQCVCYAFDQAYGCTGGDAKHAEMLCFVEELDKLVRWSHSEPVLANKLTAQFIRTTTPNHK